MYNPISRPFASPRLRARIVISLLAAGIVIALLSVIVSVGESFLPSTDIDQMVEQPAGLALVLATFLLLVVQGLLYLTSAVFLLTFLYRAHENLPALGTPKHRLQYSSGWMIGSFFVPFVSLVVPYRAVKELWQRSQPVPDDVPGIYGYDPEPPTYLGLWWLFWILANVGDNVLYRIGDGSGNEASLPLPWLAAIAHSLEAVAAVLLILVVNSIDRRQAEARASLGPEMVIGPPPPPQFHPAPNQNSPSWP